MPKKKISVMYIYILRMEKIMNHFTRMNDLCGIYISLILSSCLNVRAEKSLLS